MAINYNILGIIMIMIMIVIKYNLIQILKNTKIRQIINKIFQLNQYKN